MVSYKTRADRLLYQSARTRDYHTKTICVKNNKRPHKTVKNKHKFDLCINI